MERLDSLPGIADGLAPQSDRMASEQRAAGAPRGNLCASRQSKMLRFGVLCFSVSLAAAIAFAKAGVAPHWRWLLAAPFFLATVGVSESLLQTCPFMAMKAMRDRGDGMEPVADPQERAQLRARGQRLLLACGALALTAAGLFAELPLNF
jgi:hypothetical protein